MSCYPVAVLLRDTGRVLISIVGASVLAGCVMIPLPSDRVPTPATATAVPAEIRSSEREVMVLAQFTDSGHTVVSFMRAQTYAVIDAPVFVKGNLLESAVRALDLYSTSRFGWVGIGGAGVVKGSTQSLRRLCIVTADGSALTLEPGFERWFTRPPNRLHTAQRDAIVSTLRVDGDSPFEKTDGPCGLSGKVNWPSQARAQAIDFVARLPSLRSVERSPQIVDLIARSATAPDIATAMLIARYRWREQEFGLSPLFLHRDDLDLINSIASEIGAAGPIMLHAGSFAAYAAGTRSIEALQPDICLFERSGKTARWSVAENKWLPTLSFDDWRADAIAHVQGDARYASVAADCVPLKPPDWDEKSLRAVIDFFNTLPTERRRP